MAHEGAQLNQQKQKGGICDKDTKIPCEVQEGSEA
jgi:hypothetical protein